MITKNYIKMCKKAEEIQKLKKFNSGDWYYKKNDKDLEVLGDFIYVDKYLATRGGYDYDEYKINWNELIWLPTQEQLQNMLPEIKDKIYVAFGFNSFLRSTYNKDTLQPAYIVLNSLHPDYFCSMNEFWLCYVMKEKYNKTWTGKNWIKEDK